MRVNQPPEPPGKIERPSVVLAEGADAFWFFVWACKAWQLSEIQVVDFGGVKELRPFLRNLRGGVPGSAEIASLVVVRDAEVDACGALQSVRDALEHAGFAVPARAFELTGDKPRTAVIILPGFGDSMDSSDLWGGTLEDLCLATVPKDPVLKCVNGFLDCAKDAGELLTHPKKAALHAYLAAKDDYAGLKLGEATRKGAWKLDHSALDRVRTTLQNM